MSHMGRLPFAGYKVHVFSKAETQDTRLVRVVRNSFFWLTVRYELTPTSWRDFVHDRNRDQTSTIFDRFGNETHINLDALEVDDAVDDERAVSTFDENLRSYLDDTCCQPVPLHVRPVVHEVNRPKFIAIASVVAAAFPMISILWPRHPIASNDNDPRGTRPE